MQQVSITFKKIDVTDYYPQLDQVVFRIVYEVPSEQRLLKQISIDNPEMHARTWFQEIRETAKRSATNYDEDHPLSGVIAVGFTQDQDVILERIAKFVNQVKQQIHSAKRANMSYYDIDKQVRKNSMVFS